MLGVDPQLELPTEATIYVLLSFACRNPPAPFDEVAGKTFRAPTAFNSEI